MGNWSIATISLGVIMVKFRCECGKWVPQGSKCRCGNIAWKSPPQDKEWREWLKSIGVVFGRPEVR